MKNNELRDQFDKNMILKQLKDFGDYIHPWLEKRCSVIKSNNNTKKKLLEIFNTLPQTKEGNVDIGIPLEKLNGLSYIIDLREVGYIIDKQSIEVKVVRDTLRNILIDFRKLSKTGAIVFLKPPEYYPAFLSVLIDDKKSEFVFRLTNYSRLAFNAPAIIINICYVLAKDIEITKLEDNNEKK